MDHKHGGEALSAEAVAERNEKTRKFFEKQKELMEQWNKEWGRRPSQVEDAPKPAPRREPLPPPKYYCNGASGTCRNVATIRVSQTKGLHFSFNFCDTCWATSKFNSTRRPEGLNAIRLDGGGVNYLERKEDTTLGTAAKPEGKSSSQDGAISAFFFNGQGAQDVGMTKDVKDLPAVKALYSKAKEILGYDLQDIVLNGPREKLDNTEYSQPAMLIAGLAALEKLRATNPKAIADCTATAGLSLGEYTALVFAEVLTLEDALSLVKIRAQAMTAAAKKTPGKMLSVVGLKDSVLEAICKKIQDANPGQFVQVANYLMPEGRTVSGNAELVDLVEKEANAAKATKVSPIRVSGAFHSPLMTPASQALTQALSKVTLRQPRIAVYSNVTGKPFGNPEEIRALLARQLCEPVLWEQTIKQVLGDGHKQLWEIAPRTQIKAMVRKIDSKAHKAMLSSTV